MNENIILGMVKPYLKDSSITYNDFENIFSMLSIREQYGVIDILYKNNIELVDDYERTEEKVSKNELSEDSENFEILYDETVFMDDDKDINLVNTDFLKIRKNIQMSNQTLVRMIQEGDEQACQDLCIKNHGLVEKWAGIYHKFFGNKLEYEDLKQAGMLGLIKGARRYDLDREYAFSTYVVWWIRQSIIREIMDNGYTVRIPVHRMEQIMKTYRADKKYAYENDYQVRMKMIADEVEMPVKLIEENLKLYYQFIQATSLDTPVGEEEDTSLGDFISYENEVLIEDIVAYSFLQEQLVEVLGTLTEREQRILRLRFGLDDGHYRTLEEVGAVFGVTRERVRQIEAKALRKLRHPSRSRKLKDYLD